MEKYLECHSCRAFCWIPGCMALGDIWPLSKTTKPKGKPCMDFEPRETPLLVDELAEVTQWLLQWAESALPLMEACCPEVQEAPDLVEKDRQQFAEAHRVLAGYKEEVGHAKV